MRYRTFITALISTLSILLLSCDDPVSLKPIDTDATILAFGDSLTYGTGTSPDNAYPAVLQQLTGIKVINAGIPGETSSQGLIRLPGLIERHQPDLIIICQGGNDILRQMDTGRMKDNIQAMIDLAEQSNSQVVLVGVPDFGIFLQTLPEYAELADANQLPIAEDILSEIISDNRLKADQIHPNADGYRLLAETIASLLVESGVISGISSSTTP